MVWQRRTAGRVMAVLHSEGKLLLFTMLHILFEVNEKNSMTGSHPPKCLLCVFRRKLQPVGDIVLFIVEPETGNKVMLNT